MSPSPAAPAAPAGRVAVVIPILDEEDILPELYRRLAAVLDQLPAPASGSHGMIFVDDGSTDSTPAALDRLAGQDPRVLVLHLSRNFGHQAAITAGLDHAEGEWIAIMDGDLQDPPEALPQLLDRAVAGHDVVFAQRVRRKEGTIKRLAFLAAHRLIAGASSVRIPLDAGSFSVLSRRAVDAIRSSPEHHRYLPGLRAWAGFRQTGIEVEREARFAGAPRQTLSRLVRLTFDGLFAFSIAPLRIATALGLLTSALSSLYLLKALVDRLVLEVAPRGFATLVAFVILLAGMQLLSLGIIGEYVGRIYEQVKGRPLYVIGSVVGARGELSSGPPEAN